MEKNTLTSVVHLAENGKRIRKDTNYFLNGRIVTVAYELHPDLKGKNVKFAASVYHPKDKTAIGHRMEKVLNDIEHHDPTKEYSYVNEYRREVQTTNLRDLVLYYSRLNQEMKGTEAWSRKSNTHTARKRLELRPLWIKVDDIPKFVKLNGVPNEEAEAIRKNQTDFEERLFETLRREIRKNGVRAPHRITNPAGNVREVNKTAPERKAITNCSTGDRNTTGKKSSGKKRSIELPRPRDW